MRREGESAAEYQHRCILEFEREYLPELHKLRGKYAKSQPHVISEQEKERMMAPAACRCGFSDTFVTWPTGDALGRFTALRCQHCGRLVYISKGSGCQMWYKKEAGYT